MAQIQKFCELRRTCRTCGAPRRRHDSHCPELKTTLGKVFYGRGDGRLAIAVPTNHVTSRR